jgi:hypothetical protein
MFNSFAVDESAVSFIMCFGPEVFIIIDIDSDETLRGHPSLNSGNK